MWWKLPCHVDETGIHPVRVEEVPEHCYLLMRLIKMYEKETVEAVQEQSEEKAVPGADAASADQFLLSCKRTCCSLQPGIRRTIP